MLAHVHDWPAVTEAAIKELGAHLLKVRYRTQDPGEPGLAGQTVFLDLNGSGQLAAGDPTATTDAQGNYEFTVSSAGTYTVRPVCPPTSFTIGQPRTASLSPVERILELTLRNKAHYHDKRLSQGLQSLIGVRLLGRSCHAVH
jgi:hypothetical protein